MATCPKCRERFPDETKFCPTDGEGLLPDAAFSGVDADLQPGQVVGEYRVEKKIGEGGFGTVYLGVHPLIGKQVAIKVLSREYSSNPQMVSRFIEEAAAVNKIRHRNIIDIFSFDELEDKRRYFVMEYLDGKPFDVLLRERGRLRPEEAIPILRQIARALDAAHAAGIAHRDLKPENVFVSVDDDGAPFVKLLDFGIAKLIGDSQRSGHRTRTGQPIGTPYYMSPEQCLAKNIDHRTDIYSFGVMCHEVLVGKLPFFAEELMNVLVMQMTQEPPRMSTVCPELPARLDEPVLRMLAKQPDNRPSSVTAGLEALAQAARDAGFPVEVVQRRPGMSTPGLLPLASRSDRSLTPAEQAAMGAADTMALGSSPAELATLASSAASGAEAPRAATAGGIATATTGMGSSVTAPPSGGRRALLVVASVGLLAAAAVTVFVVRGTGGEAAGTEPNGAGSTAASTEPTAPSEAPAPSGTATASAATAAFIELTIPNAKPKGLEIYLGEEKLGVAPGPIQLPRRDDEVELTFKAAGYHSKSVKTSCKANLSMVIELQRATPGGAKPTGTGTAGPPPPPPPTKTKTEVEF